jgi:hypothetical protein
MIGDRVSGGMPNGLYAKFLLTLEQRARAKFAAGDGRHDGLGFRGHATHVVSIQPLRA